MTICRYNARVKLYKNLKCCRLSHARVLWAHFLRFPIILRKDSLTRHARTQARTHCRFLCVHTLNWAYGYSTSLITFVRKQQTTELEKSKDLLVPELSSHIYIYYMYT